MKILVINTGSTSTKLAVYNNCSKIWSTKISHSNDDLSSFNYVYEQYEFRKNIIIKSLTESNIEIDFSVVIARGGFLKPTIGGVYEINKRIIDDLRLSYVEHASNLSAPIAVYVASISKRKCVSYIADPIVTDELSDISRISGLPELPRVSVFHALNSRAVSRNFALEINRRYEDMNIIVVHMGGGISISAHAYGKVIDVNNAVGGEGPFSPERAGSLPAAQLVKLCFSGKYSCNEMLKKINGNGGLYAHLGTTDVESIVNNIINGDNKSKLILDAMIYNIAKCVGSMHIALKQKTDVIILTGGIAYCKYVTDKLLEWLNNLAMIKIIPGEDEMDALAKNAFDAYNKNIVLQLYNPT